MKVSLAALFVHLFLGSSEALFRGDKSDPLSRPFADAFSARLSEVMRVRQPAAVTVVNYTTLFVSSFLGDAVLQTSLPLNSGSQFRVFAHGSYCTPDLRRCAILNGPWGLAHAHGRLYVSSFGSDQILVFEVSTGRFLDALGDPSVLDSPEGLAASHDGSVLFVASFLNSRIVAFDIQDDGEFDIQDDGEQLGLAPPGRIVVCGRPVDLDYLMDPDDGSFGMFDDGGERSSGVGGRHSSNRGICIPELHGPEDVVVLGDGRLAVTSYYNSSVLIVDSAPGKLVEVVTGPPGTLDGPMGITLDEDCDDFSVFGRAGDGTISSRFPGGGPCLLVAAYKSKAPGRISRFVRQGGRGWTYGGAALASENLHGPACVAVLPDGALACAYDASALLSFNATEMALDHKAVISVSGTLRLNSEGEGAPQQHPRKRRRMRRRLGGGE